MATVDGIGEPAQLDLPPAPESVREARRFVRERLEAWDLDAFADDATLCCSEVVTNSVLHAGTRVSIVMRRVGRGVRVEVTDGRTEPPVAVPRWGTAADITADGLTGRGLHVVDAYASSWGVQALGRGKVVWFEVGTPEGGPPPDAAPGEPAAQHDAAVAAGPLVSVKLRSMPVRAAVGSGRHVDDLVRDLQLVLAGGRVVLPAGIADRLRALLDRSAAGRLAGRAAALQAAARGEHRFDLTMTLPLDTLAGTAELNVLLNEVSTLVGSEAIIPAREVQAFRVWVVEEIGRQLGGAAATLCPLPD
jgi:anti-sigma regulatory factor (Ser/Thr protein kinase)